MGNYNITLIPGDGIGPEIINSAVRCIETAGVKVNWDVQIAGESARKKFKNPLPKALLESILKNRVVLKGPLTTPVGKGFRSVNVQLRRFMHLFANVRPVKTYPGVKSFYKNIDLVVIRENTEDLYSGIEFEKGKKDTKELIKFVQEKKNFFLTPDTGVSLKTISEHASRRIAEFAFAYAMKNNREKITLVHKANIMKYSDGLFLETAKKVAKRHPQIGFEDRIVDNMAMQLVQKPQEYDILLLPNLYGDIVSDLCAGLAGSLGLAPSGNFGARGALFEPVHGSAPKYAGKNKVNPCAAIFSGIMMLKYLGEKKAAETIERAVLKVLREGKYVTYDLARRRPLGTKQMSDTIIREIEKLI